MTGGFSYTSVSYSMFGVNIVSASQVSIFGLPVVQNPVFRNASLQLDGSAMIK